MSKAKRYRKKPVVVEAMQLSLSSSDDVLAWVRSHGVVANYYSEPPMRAVTGILIPTLEGDMVGVFDDYIIKGVQGEFYPCKPDIFRATYEAVGQGKSVWVTQPTIWKIECSVHLDGVTA